MVATRPRLSPAQRKAIAQAYARKNMNRTVVTGGGVYKKKAIKSPMYRAPVARRGRYIQGSGAYGSGGFYKAGSAIGSAIGGALGSGLGYITGMGKYDYPVRANSIMGGVYDPPELHNRSDRVVCLRHREYITDIVASDAFTLQSFSINPGLVASFPWLSQVAEAFEEYRFTGLVYEFKTLSCDYTTASSGALGYVVLSTQYNVLNPDFPDKKTMENYEFSNSAKPSESFFHPVECKRSLNPVSELFVRTGSPTSGDLRLYDHGKFQIATGGNTGTGVLGELWATFEIELYKPKLIENLGLDLLTDHWHTATGITNINPLGTVKTLSVGSNLGTTITGNFDRIVNFPEYVVDGNFMFVYRCKGSSAGLVQPSITTFNCTLLTYWQESTLNNVANSGSTNDEFYYNFIVKVTGPKATLEYNGDGTLPISATSIDLWIMQINGNIQS